MWLKTQNPNIASKLQPNVHKSLV